MSTSSTASIVKPVDSLWTRLLVDPVAVPLARRLARVGAVTPNRVTAVAGALGVLSAGLFAVGRPRLAGVVFMVHFLADCVDGKVARARGTSSTRGQALDYTFDTFTGALNYGALGWWLARQGSLEIVAPILLVGMSGWFVWILEYRKHLADRVGVPGGGRAGTSSRYPRVVRPWVDWCARRGYIPVPYSVEVEQFTLGVAPLALPTRGMAVTIWLAIAFYVLASGVNLRRIWRLARQGDDDRASRESAV